MLELVNTNLYSIKVIPTGNWNAEIFKIFKVNQGSPTTYFIGDFTGALIKGLFYQEELLKRVYPDTFLIEKVLRKRGDNLLVKWLGYKDTTWIQKSAIE